MQKIFEEYGRTILAVVVGLLLVALIFGGLHLYGLMGDGMNVDTEFHHSDSEESIKQISVRTAPTVTVADSADLHLYVDRIFKPVDTVTCVDNDGTSVQATVTKIVFIAADGSQTNVTGKYDAAADELDIADAVNKTGVLAVTFRAVDSYNMEALQTISYVVDAIGS